jgi:hypothetical protein
MSNTLRSFDRQVNGLLVARRMNGGETIGGQPNCRRKTPVGDASIAEYSIKAGGSTDGDPHG